MQKKKLIPPKNKIINIDSRPMFTGNAVYALFPIWFVTGETNGKKITFLVNGQTGKVFGNPPYSEISFRKNVALKSLIIVPTLFVLLYLLCMIIAYTIVIPPLWGATLSLLFVVVSLFSIILGMVRYRLRAVEKAIITSTSDTLLDFVKRRSKDV